MKRLKNNNYVNLDNVNIIKKEKDDYFVIVKRKIKNEFVKTGLKFDQSQDISFFKKYGLFKVQDYFINIEKLVFVNVIEKNSEKVRVEFIFSNMSYETLINTNFFNYWENHYL